MRIGIDYTVALKQSGGIGRITRGLVAGAMALDQRNSYLLLHARDAQREQAFIPEAQWRTLPLSERMLNILWHRAHLPIAVETFSGPLDIFHAPNFTLPPSQAARRILTIHDLTFLRYPDGAHPSLRRFLVAAVPRSVRAATHIIADSQATRQDLIEWLKVSPERISVVYAGVDDRFKPIVDEGTRSRVRERYRLQRPFILCVGTLEPRKNYDGLMHAFERAQLADFELLIAGRRGWLDEPIIEKAQTTVNVRLLGFVDDADLPCLYSLASAYCMPSHYEGFGIPCIEAMACGTPVVCSNRPCLPEIVGDAALLVAPEDHEAMAEALRSVLSNSELRRSLIERGFGRARQFPWSRGASALLDVYEARVRA